MSLTLGSLSTGSLLHGSIETGLWSSSRAVQTFFGVTGEYHLLGGLHGRDLQCWLQFHGYASHKVLQDDIETANNSINQYGTLTVAISGETSKTFTKTIFLGWEATEPPWADASGVNGWICLGRMNFRQVKS